MVELEEMRNRFTASVSLEPFECAVYTGLEWIQSSSSLAPKAKVIAMMPAAWAPWRNMGDRAKEMSLELQQKRVTPEVAYRRFLELERELRERYATQLEKSASLDPEGYESSYMSYLDNVSSLAREFFELRRPPCQPLRECFDLVYEAGWAASSKKELLPEELKTLGRLRNDYMLTASPKSAELFVATVESLLPRLESRLGREISERISNTLDKLQSALLVEEL